jgi:hypothetical protein
MSVTVSFGKGVSCVLVGSLGVPLDDLDGLYDGTVHLMLAKSECEVQSCRKPLVLEDFDALRILIRLT